MEQNNLKLHDQVEFIKPLADETGLSFTIINISQEDNWCLLEANVPMAIKPTITANLDQLKKV